MNMTERFKVVPSVYLLAMKDGKILLLRRFQTGYFDGYYGLPAGHLEKEEMPADGMMREAYEEAGIRVRKDDLRFVHLLYRMSNIPASHERADFFFTADTWVGEPENKEPEKCDDLRWFPLDGLPENIVPEVRQAIEYFQRGVLYSEYGIEKNQNYFV